MSGQIVHTEILVDDTEAARAFWGQLFGWQFEAFPPGSEYHMARISDTSGIAISGMESGRSGTRSYFDVTDIDAEIARVKGARWRGRREDARSLDGLVRDLPRSPRQRLRALAGRRKRAHANEKRPPRGGYSSSAVGQHAGEALSAELVETLPEASRVADEHATTAAAWP